LPGVPVGEREKGRDDPGRVAAQVLHVEAGQFRGLSGESLADQAGLAARQGHEHRLAHRQAGPREARDLGPVLKPVTIEERGMPQAAVAQAADHELRVKLAHHGASASQLPCIHACAG
jgi:hypothetical protein